ncbi:hypothetical protein BS17DRAFT_458042 [Gyrodon lividus]|nr:hypothetical protein BS17DRAFT_458042 [Gyrodon lividus]
MLAPGPRQLFLIFLYYTDRTHALPLDLRKFEVAHRCGSWLFPISPSLLRLHRHSLCSISVIRPLTRCIVQPRECQTALCAPRILSRCYTTSFDMLSCT